MTTEERRLRGDMITTFQDFKERLVRIYFNIVQNNIHEDMTRSLRRSGRNMT